MITLESNPRALRYLFAAAAGHSFAFYVIVNHLVLWLLSGGTAQAAAQQTFGYYIASAYVLAVLGGGLASHFGARSIVLFGALCYTVGLSVLVLTGYSVAVLGVLALGSGLIKPNLVALVGRMFPKGSALTDRAIARFYSAINVGATLAAVIGGYLSTRVSFRAAFIAALIGEVLVLSALVLGAKHLKLAESESSMAPLIGNEAARSPELKATMDVPAIDRQALRSLMYFLIGVAVAFWPSYHQNNAGLNIWAESYTNRVAWGFDVPPTWFAVVNSVICMFLVVPITGLVSRLKLEKVSSAIGYGLMCLSFVLLGVVGLTDSSHSMLWLIGAITLSSLSEVLISVLGLTRVLKQAPRRYDSLFTAIWYCTVAIGGIFAGWIGSLGLLQGFVVFAGLTALAGLFEWWYAAREQHR